MLFVSHAALWVTTIERSDSDWATHEARTGDTVELLAPKLSFSVDELYSVLTPRGLATP